MPARRSALLAVVLPALLLSPGGVCPAQQAETAAQDEGFRPLFDGQSIDQWVRRGGEATYEVRDGMIVGTSTLNTANTFLCTPREYGDFVLELELKIDRGLNSGVQVRSHAYDERRVVEGTRPNGERWRTRVSAGRVHGYQVEVDTNPDRAWSGGIYDEARRGWLYPLAGEEHKEARAAFKYDDWNTYRIEAKGDRIRTWVNGVPCADLKDDPSTEGLITLEEGPTLKGFIALQVHGIGGNRELEGTQVRWRNLRIKEL